MSTYKYPELPDDYATRLPQIAKHELRIMWQHDYWDRPLSGMIRYQDKPHWFYFVDDGKEPIRFILLEVSQEQYKEEHYWNELFREKVGTHWDYDEEGKSKRYDETGRLKIDRLVKPQTMHAEFYDASKNRKLQDFSQNKIVGWFEW
jgi:hypothetical protein